MIQHSFYEKLTRSLIYWLIPQGIKDVKRLFERRIFRGISSHEEKQIFNRNNKWQGKYKKRRCFVIGNGPSLANHDLEPLGQEITIVMNSFNRHPVLRKWKPTFYCRAEPAISYDSPERIASIPNNLEGINADGYFFPIEAKPIFDKHRFLPEEKIFFVLMKDSINDYKSINLAAPIPLASDTSILAIMVALGMGFSEIYLIGLDYDWLSHRSYHKHFYDKNDPKQTREHLSNYRYLDLIKSSFSAWVSHEMLREIGRSEGQHIFNATQDGFLDVYEEITLAEALSRNQHSV